MVKDRSAKSRGLGLNASSLLQPLRSCLRLDCLRATHIRLQHIRHRDRTALLLIGLHDSDERAADGDARAVERVDVVKRHVSGASYQWYAFEGGAKACSHASRLELAAKRAGGDLPVHILPA